MVYVVANDGQPLMPTERHGKVCRMLRSGMAKVIKKCPFTIQLQYESERNVQPVSLGVDARSKHIGISATTKTKVLYESDVELRDDIVKLLATRRQLRRSRRSRKTRYRLYGYHALGFLQCIERTVRTGYPSIDDLWVSDKEYPYRAWLTERTLY